MRDPEWLCDRYGLIWLDANSAVSRTHSVTATYRALNRAQVNVQVAYAWISHPKSDQEADSPWFAVDLAMSF